MRQNASFAGKEAIPALIDESRVQQLREACHGLLRELVKEMDITAASEILERRICRFDDVIVEFKLDETSGQIGIYADIGKPDSWQELETCRQLLSLQLDQGTPALWMAGRHPDSGHAVFVTHFPLGGSIADSISHFRAQIDIGVQTARAFRAEILKRNN